MNVLIGDIGNTVTKICLVETKKFTIIKIIYFNSIEIKSKKLLEKNFKKIISKQPAPITTLFSCVVPEYQKIVKYFLINNYQIKLNEIKDKNINKLIKVNIKNKQKVGSDRIANAVGAFIKYKTNCIVLDFGTATTFDVVTKKGVYVGGVIAPGINLSIKSLSKFANQIPIFSIKKQSKVIGKNTLEALRSGFYWGYSGLINNIIFKIENETNKKYKIIFTGGYASLFKTSIKRSFRIDRNITINGITEIFKHNKKKLI
jgi:type III pantothenate kinase